MKTEIVLTVDIGYIFNDRKLSSLNIFHNIPKSISNIQ